MLYLQAQNGVLEVTQLMEAPFTGYEYNGILKLTGTYDSISFSINPNEYWHGFKVGASAPVPEPGTMILLGFGMLGLAVYGKRRLNKEA